MATTPKVILALDVRSYLIGYAAFEYSSRLLEAGITRMRDHNIAKRRLQMLVKRFHPSIIVLRRLSRKSSRNTSRTRAVIKIVRDLARHSQIGVAQLSPDEVHRAFAKEGAGTKYQIARVIADRFPELAWRLPPSRRPWQPERHRMSAFDAAALGVSYLSTPFKSAANMV